MSPQHERITRKLTALGAAWAVRSDKYTSPDDSLDDRASGRKTWHVHPDASEPDQRSIRQFDTLAELEAWIQARKDGSEWQYD